MIDRPEPCASAQHVVEVGLGERFDFERQPLMNAPRRGRIAAKPRDRARISPLAPVAAVWAPLRPRAGDQGGRLFLVPGEHHEPAPAPLGIGERRGDGMPAIEPASGAGGLAARICAMHTFSDRRESAAALHAPVSDGCVRAGLAYRRGPRLTKSSRHLITRVPLRRAARDPEGWPSG